MDRARQSGAKSSGSLDGSVHSCIWLHVTGIPNSVLYLVLRFRCLLNSNVTKPVCKFPCGIVVFIGEPYVSNFYIPELIPKMGPIGPYRKFWNKLGSKGVCGSFYGKRLKICSRSQQEINMFTFRKF